MKLSAVLIVKNEEKVLEGCLKTLQGFDEIVVVDTGSVDKTWVVARNWADKLDFFKWNDNFAEARNYALSKATGDWILSIDADETLESETEKVRKTAEEAEEKGLKAVDIIQESRSGETNLFPRLFKRCPEVYWAGAIHNHLSVAGQMKSDVKIRYGYSPAHQLDPDRALRILKREVDKGGKVREMYYLAREYWYRKAYILALWWYQEYLKVSKWLPERADAWLMMAKCYWNLRQGEKARESCLQALSINADFKEALEFMAELSWEHNAKKWRQYAEMAENNNVLFIRSKSNIKRILDKNINDAEHYNNYWLKRGFKTDYTEPKRMEALIRKFKGGRFLDLGCGLFPCCEMAQKVEGSEVWGLDISDQLIESLKSKDTGIHYEVGDVNNLKFEDNFFDYVVAGEVLEHMENPKETLKGIVRIIKPGGTLALSVPNDDMGGYAKDWHLWSFTKKGVEELLKPFGDVETEWMTENRHRYGHIIGYLKK